MLLTSALSAQNYEKNILGIRAGLNLSDLSLSDEGVTFDTNSRAGFHIAVTDQILLCHKMPLYLETGLVFSSRGGKVKDDTMRPSYLQIPVLINYHFNIKNIVSIQPFAGIYYGVGICGKAKDKDENVKYDIFGKNGGLKRSDLGVRLGAGVEWHHFYFGLGYEIGCLNQLKDTDLDGDKLNKDRAKLRNNCFTLSVGYNF